MASSQVEIASSSSSSPFGHVLRDRNSRRDRCTFHKNLKELVIHSCISSQPPPTSASDSNENQNTDFEDLWVHKPQWNNSENYPTNKPTSNHNKWDRAREMVLSSSRPKQHLHESPNNLGGGVSTLVRRWRDFETVSKNPNLGNNCSTARSNGDDTCCDESFSVDGRFDTPRAMSLNGDLSADWEPDIKTAMNDMKKENEKLRVVDIIRKLATSRNAEENHEAVAIACAESLPRIKISSDHSEQQQQQRCFFPVLHSPRIIRGRQALSDLILQMERDRHRELEALKDRKAVSKFQQRGRIQALLKVRFLRRVTDNRDNRSTNITSSDSNRRSHSAITHIRERFNTGSQNSVTDSRSLSREEVADNSTSNQQRIQKCDRENKSCSREVADNNAAKVGSELASSKQRDGNQKQEIIRENAGLQPRVADSRSTLGFSSTSKQENDPAITLHKKVDNTYQVGKVFTSNQLREENHHGEVNDKINLPRVTTNIEVTSSSLNPQRVIPLNTQHSDISCSPNNDEVDCSHQAVGLNLPHCSTQLQSLDISHVQASCDQLLEFVEKPRPPKNIEQCIHKEEPLNNLQHAGSSTDWEEEATNQNLVETSDCGWVSDYSHTASGWDEVQSNYQLSESNQDWASDISRPRQEWEGLRQARYQEMLDPFLENPDIRQLLHRKSVSIFLNSGLREKIDQLMASRSQLPNPIRGQLEGEVGAHTEDKDREEEVAKDETRQGTGEDNEEDSGYEDDYEDDITPIRQQLDEPEESVDLKKASQSLQSWSNNQDQGGGDEFPSKSLEQSQSPIICSHHNQQCSSSRLPSIEMELIYELRGHMEQLHQEIFEIRRSIKSCVNMQMKLQHSIKQEVAAAITQSGPMIGKNSDDSKKGAKRANCCICYEGPVDSLLYRCGHMCTCFRCAHELLWGTGKCPICETPIIDVVRAYIHS